jgi:hypothetical protein
MNKNNKPIADIFNRLSRSDVLQILKLNESNKGSEDYDGGEVGDIEDIIRPAVLAFSREVIRRDGVPPDGEGWAFTPAFFRKRDGVIEVMLVRSYFDTFIPSTSSQWWEAKANSVDSTLGVKNPAEALAWGLSEAIAYFLAGDISHLRDGKHFPKLKRSKSKTRKVVVT